MLAKERMDDALKNFQAGIAATVPGVSDSDVYQNPSLEGRFSPETLLKLLAAKAEAVITSYSIHYTKLYDHWSRR